MDLNNLTFAERRAVLHKIPTDTPYCYSYDNDEYYCCPFWEAISRSKDGYASRARCNLSGHKDKYSQDSSTLLWDQVKCCGHKRGF